MWKHQQRGRSLLLLITACSAQGFLLLGYDQGVMGGIIGAENEFGMQFGNPDADLQGNIVALYDIGCVVGSIFCFFFGEKLGRRTMIMLGGSIMILGTVVLGSSYTVAQLIVGRIVTGIGNGINSSTIPVYLGECAPPGIRGMLLTFNGTTTILGLCIAYWCDYGLSFVSSSVQWRFPLAFQAFFAICLVLQIIGLPETPRWLVQHDRQHDARAVLSALLDQPPSHPGVEASLTVIQTSLLEESRGGPFKYRELWSHGKLQNWRRMLLTIGMGIMQQFTGSNFLNYYGPSVYETLCGFSRNMSLILGGAASLVYLVGSVCPLWLVERHGRRALLMLCGTGLALCFAVVAILLSFQRATPAKASIAFIFLFQFVYGLGWLPVPWFYAAEINTTRLRTRGGAIASAWNWMSVFAVVKITPIGIANIGWRCFVVFAVLNAAFVPIVYCFYPETSGLELEDIDLIFEKGGFTGGVLSSRGRPVVPGQHARNMRAAKEHGKMETDV